MSKQPESHLSKKSASSLLGTLSVEPAGLPLRTIDVEEFVRRLRADTTRDKRFALFLGAGCSVSSGIPAAGGLVRDHWLPRLRDLQAPLRQDLETWAIETIPGYRPQNPAASYGELIQRLFLTSEDRQREIENLCEGRIPAFGYAVLAHLIAMDGGRFNIVLTTNFDDLVADALYLYTEARPLVIQHESLAAFIRPTRTRPLVIKLHGDHRLAPRNTLLEIETLEATIRRQTAMVLHDRGLILIGYGGADHGIHKMFQELPPEALPYGAYWVSPEAPSGPMRTWLANKGIWVQSGWFDELMLLIGRAFELPHPDSSRFLRIFDNYQETLKELSEKNQTTSGGQVKSRALQNAIAETEASLPSDLKLLYLAAKAKRISREDPGRADALYREGLEDFQSAVPLVLGYASFLETVRKDADAAEMVYKRALKADPKDAQNLGEYAFFLERVRKDADAAEMMYKRALEASPQNAHNLGKFARFLEKFRKDADAAEVMYERALKADPRQATTLSNYAVFLEDIRNNPGAAEAMYKRAVSADSKNANALSNYAVFLENVRNDPGAAEVMYKRALDAAPLNANILGNYAGHLLALGRSEGLDVLDRALAEIDAESPPGLALECSFYLFAHGPAKSRRQALSKVCKLIEAGERSPGWNLSRNVERALQEGHPEAYWLYKLTAVINGNSERVSLEAWPAWKAAAIE